jgi:photosystem II stability/assembly factor-like uncharacterized protein
MKVKFYILFIFSVVLFHTVEIHAQWTQSGLTVPKASLSSGGIFFEHGVLWVAGGEVYDISNGYQPFPIYSSVDTGKTWRTHYLPTKKQYDRTILSIRFYDNQNGIVSTLGDSSFITNDGGITWHPAAIYSFDARMINSPNDIIFASGGLFISHDGGQTVLPTSVPYGFYLAQSYSGSIYGGTEPLNRITNSGNTVTALKTTSYWPDIRIEAGKDCSDSLLYFVNLGDASNVIGYDGFVRIYISNDAGNSVNESLKRAAPATPFAYSKFGGLSTSRHACFASISDEGIYRSTNKGKSWSYVGNLMTRPWTQSIAAVNDSILFVLDSDGVVWKTTHSGTGMFKVAPPHPPIASGFTISSISACDSAVGFISISNHYCNPFIVSSATVGGVDKQNFGIVTSPFPIRITDSDLIKIPVSFLPKKRSRTFVANVHLSGYFLDYEDTIYYDTTVTIKATSTGSFIPVLSDSKVLFDTVSTCTQPFDTVITVTNKGCDTIRITGGPGVLPTEFKLLPPFTLPIILPPDSIVTIHFRFAPTSKGHYTSTLVFVLEQQDATDTILLQLEGVGIEAGGLLSYSPKQFEFPSLSICAHDSASGFVTNIGCDSMRIDGNYFGDVDYLGSGFGISGWVKPGDTIFFKAYINPSQKGIRHGYIILTSFDNIRTAKDSIPFTVTVLDGTKILSASQSIFDFGTTSLCAEKDTTVTLHNTGCDTLWVKSLGVGGSGFGVENTSFFIPPGGSKTIDVHTVIDTNGHVTSNSDQLTIQSDAENTISPITLTRSFTYPKDYSVRFAVSNPSGKNQDQVTMQIIADSLPQGLTQLSANLTIGNTDLLSFVDYASPNQVTINGNQISITGSPIKTTGNILAELHYRVFLTNDSTTSINFSNVSFNNADPDYANCVATVQGAGNAGYNYEFRCAEHTIAKLLRNEQIRISSINPNPTQGEITVTVESPIKTDGIIEVYDILGKQVISESKSLNKGKNSILLDTKSIARGRYSVRLKTESSETQGAFVKE